MTVTELSFADVPDIVTVPQAAELCHLSTHTIKAAIKRGELEAFLPGQRNVRWPGRGMGYRIATKHLQAWFFGAVRRKDA